MRLITNQGTSATKEEVLAKMKNVASSVSSIKSMQMDADSHGGMRPANLKEISVEHGATNIFELRFDDRIATAAYHRYNQKYVVVDNSGVMHCVDSRSQITCTHSLHHPIGNLVYNQLAKKFVAWTKGEAFLVIIDESLTEIGEVTHRAPLVAMAASTFREEIVTADNKGILTKWTLKISEDEITKNHLQPTQEFELKGTREGCHNVIVRVTCLAVDKGGPQFNICLVSYSTTVAEISWDDGTIVHKRQVHNTEVTALFYNEVRSHVVTGAKDGTIKVWNSEWKLVCLLVGHVRNVVQVESCPMTPFLLMSASLDRSVRIWNVDAGLEVSRINIKGGAKGLVVHRFDRQFFVFGERIVSLWKVEQLLVLLTVLSSPVETLSVASHPLLPSRLLVGCSNNSLSLLSMSTGATVSWNKLDAKSNPHVATAVSVVEGVILVLLPGDKGLVRLPYDDTYPHLTDHWSHFPVPITCITLYEHLVDIQALRRNVPEHTRATRARLYRSTEPSAASSRSRRKSTNLVLLFTGHADGRLRHIGIEDGTILASVSGHCGKILQLCHIAKMSQMLSLGSDETIRIWQVFPYSDVVLMPLKSIPLPGSPVLFTMLPRRVAVAFTSKRILIYNLSNPIPMTHCVEDDHTDEICDLASLDSQQVFASASKDKSVRLWSITNRLLRVLKLDEVPSKIVFSSQRGDIVISMWKHVFRLPFEKFLPVSILSAKPVRITTARGPSIETISEDRCYYHASEEDQSATLLATPSVVTDPTRLERDKILRYLAERNEDIRRIRDGKLPPQRFTQPGPSDVYDDAFLKLFEAVWGKYFKPPSKVELLSPPSNLTNKISKRNSDLLIETQSKKFFPPTGKMRTDSPAYDVNKFRLGFIPNSVIIRILWPENDSWHAWQTWSNISLDKGDVEDEEQSVVSDVTEPRQSVCEEVKGYQTCVIVRKGNFARKEDLQELEVIFAKMVPYNNSNMLADISWLAVDEQKMLCNEASTKWRILSVICSKGKHARRLCERATKIMYLPKPRPRSKSRDTRQISFATKAIYKKDRVKRKRWSEMKTTQRKVRNAHKYCAPQLKLREEKGKSKMSLSGKSESKLRGSPSSATTSSSETSTNTSDISERQKSYHQTIPLMPLNVDEVIEMLVKCALGMSKHRYCKSYAAKLLRGIGVTESDILIEEIHAWVKDAKRRRIIDTSSEFYVKAVTWLKLWMLQYVHHVLVSMEELRRGQLTGRIHYSMVQLILQQNKGATVTPPLEHLTPQDEIYLLSLTCPDSPDQSLVETVKPVEVLNYFCEIFSEEKRQDEIKTLMKKSYVGSRSRHSLIAPGLAVDQSVQDVTTVNKGCAMRNTNCSAWPKGIHLPLKTAEIVLFRKTETSRQDSRLLSYQTCSKHFVHSDSYH